MKKFSSAAEQAAESEDLMEFFNSAVDTLQTVSYTHLDVYKRQEFDIAKGRFSFRLTAPYSEERRKAARQYARDSNAADRLK